MRNRKILLMENFLVEKEFFSVSYQFYIQLDSVLSNNNKNNNIKNTNNMSEERFIKMNIENCLIINKLIKIMRIMKHKMLQNVP